jgi:hypothetical protein
MHHQLLLLCLLLPSIGLSTVAAAQDGPTLPDAQRSLPSGTVFADRTDAALYLRGAIGAESDAAGNITIDMGSASSGRCMFNLNDVVLAIEMRDAERGCADICPPRAIITADCTHGPCTSDTMMRDRKYGSCSFSVMDQAIGAQAYETLRILQRFLQ